MIYCMVKSIAIQENNICSTQKIPFGENGDTILWKDSPFFEGDPVFLTIYDLPELHQYVNEMTNSAKMVGCFQCVTSFIPSRSYGRLCF